MSTSNFFAILEEDVLDENEDFFTVPTSGPSSTLAVTPAPKKKSEIYKLYSTMYYNVPGGIEKVKLSNSKIAIPYSDLYHKFSDRFNLAKLEDMWKASQIAIHAWEADNPNKSFFPPVTSISTYQERSINYEYDHLLWRLQVVANDYAGAGVILNIKFSNDGFLYKKHDEMAIVTDKDGIPRDNQTMHNRPGWCVLDLQKYSSFDTFKAFAKIWLKQNRLRFQVCYNDDCGRIDFKAYDNANQRNVCISFEPGYPESDLSDCWLEE